MNLLRILSTLFWLALLPNAGCERAPNTTAATTTAPPATLPSDPTSLPTDKTTTIETTFDDLKFEQELGDPFEREMITPRTEALLGRSIRIRGYIYPTAKRRGLKQFVLVRDNLECCFGPGAALYDCILVKMEPGRTAEFSIRPVAVEGTLRFEEVIGPEGNLLVIYQMDGREVR